MRLRQIFLIISSSCAVISGGAWLWFSGLSQTSHETITIVWRHGEGNFCEEKKAISQELNKAGWSVSQNLKILDAPTPEQLKNADMIIMAPDAPSLEGLDIPTQKPIVVMAAHGEIKHSIHTNVASLIYEVPAEQYVELIKQYLPEVDSVGLVRHSNHRYSDKYMTALKDEAERNGITIFEVFIDDKMNVDKMIVPLADQVDCLLFMSAPIPSDLSQHFMRIAEKNEIPVFTNDKHLVPKGAVAAISFDEVFIGSNVGTLVVDMIKHHSPRDIQLDIGAIKTYINSERLSHYEMIVPKDLKKSLVDVVVKNETSTDVKG